MAERKPGRGRAAIQLLSRALLALGLTALAAVIVRLRGSGGTPPHRGGWRELSVTDLEGADLGTVATAGPGPAAGPEVAAEPGPEAGPEVAAGPGPAMGQDAAAAPDGGAGPSTTVDLRQTEEPGKVEQQGEEQG